MPNATTRQPAKPGNASPSAFQKTLLAQAVAVALTTLAVPSTSALAADICGAGLTTINSVQLNANNCVLGAGDSLNVVTPGSITPGGGDAVTVSDSTTAGSISNSGTISGSNRGIDVSSFSGSSSVGSISNSGTISGNNTGIRVSSFFGSSSVGSISNSGSISGVFNGISIFISSTVGSITNNAGGTIFGGSRGILVNGGSSVTGSITNNAGGTISSGNNTSIQVVNSSTVGSISNSGTISGGSGGSGILVSNNSTVSGGISNNAGGTISGGVFGIFVSNNSSVGSISNSGTISGSSSGILVAGGSAVSGGISNNAGGTISGNTGIRVSNNSIVGSITNNGTISGGVNSIFVEAGSVVTGGIINTGAINGAVGLNGATLNLNGTNGNVTGAVTGAAASVVNVNGTFTTANTFNIGTFNIASGGRLNMGNAISAITFNNAGTLAVAAGATSTITGNYTQLAGGVFESGLTNNTSFGRLVVTGTANLTASNAIAVNVVGAPTLTAGTVLSSVISATTLTAGPAFTITDNSALFNFTGAINGNAIDLTIVRGSTTVSAVTSSGMTSGLGAAVVFDSAPAGLGTVTTALGLLPNSQAVADAILQTLPFSDSITQSTLANRHSANAIVLARSEANKKGLASGDSFSNRGAWVKPLGSWADQKDRSGAFGYDARTYGIIVGADGDLSKDSRLGAAFAYTRSNVDGNSGLQAADVDSYGVTLYGTQNLNQGIELNWQADYGHHQNEGRRRIAFVNQTASSDYNSNSIHLGIGVARSMITGVFGPKTIFTPSLRADYTRIRDDGYTETGAGALNLVVNGRSTDELIVAVDGKLSHALDAATTLNANLGVGYDTQAKQSSVTSAFQGGGAAFATTGINPPKTLIRGGLGLVINTKRALEVTARYDVEARKDFTNQTASVKFKMPF